MTADPNNPELLVRVASEVEAIAIVTALAAEGVEATRTGSYTAGFQAEAPGMVQVLVRQKDLARARVLMDELRGGAD